MRLHFGKALICALALSGCAGPTTPLGAVWSFSPSQSRGPDLDEMMRPQNAASASAPVLKLAKAEIQMKPSRQVLHGRANLKVKVKDPTGNFENYRLLVKYNGFDVTQTYLRSAKMYQLYRQRVLVMENPSVKLSAEEDHRIEFAYKSSAGHWTRARYEPPVCEAFKSAPVHTTGSFNPPNAMVTAITRLSEESGFNPALFMALVAQESSFDPTVVSWAKAIGLTQVTTPAETEIVRKFANWPRYPGIDEMSAAQVKLMIMNGTINSKNEWRLDTDRSVKGGLAYARLLAERWSTPENLERIRKTFKDPQVGYTQLILASYNSGYHRVREALDERGKDWMSSPELGEARKYVNKIFSYCSYFSESEEDQYATET